MSKFQLSTTSHNIASQIADLLNRGGQLAHYFSADAILYNPITYVIEMYTNKVIAIIGLEIKNPQVTELKHLCVHPDYRRRGLGKRMLELGIKAASTDYIYGCVRSDNHSNIRNNLRVGLRPIGRKYGRLCFIIVFARRKYDRYTNTENNRT